MLQLYRFMTTFCRDARKWMAAAFFFFFFPVIYVCVENHTNLIVFFPCISEFRNRNTQKNSMFSLINRLHILPTLLRVTVVSVHNYESPVLV